MIDCDEQPGRPPDSTVCRDRRSRRPSTGGPRAGPRLTDAELLTLAVAQVLLGVNNSSYQCGTSARILTLRCTASAARFSRDLLRNRQARRCDR